jgi:uncharacterized protein YcbK (DUF882 family)
MTVGLAALLSGAAPAVAQPEGELPEAPPPEPEQPAAAAPAKPGKASRKKPKIRPTSGYAVAEEKLRKRMPPPPSGNIHLRNLYRQEELKVNIFNADGSYNNDILKQLSHLLRCKRTDTEIAIEPRLFTILSHVYDHFGGRRIEITSGYRNQRKTTSNHYRGSATDIMIEGVHPKRLRGFIESLDAGFMGVGIYPKSGFVHVDIRPPPAYRWIDYSPTDPSDPNRRPLPIFKKKKRGVS